MFWLVGLAWLLLVANASAFYDPGLQRWINRDPLGDQGSTAYKATRSMPRAIVERTRGFQSQEGDFENQFEQNLHDFTVNSPVTWIDPLGLEIKCSGPDKANWEKLLDNWRANLPKDSALRKVIADLDRSKDKVTIKPLKGVTDAKKQQVKIPYGESTVWGNEIVYIDFGESYYFNNDPTRRKYSNPEALGHELLHSHDNLIRRDRRGHDDGFWDDEKQVTEDARTCPQK